MKNSKIICHICSAVIKSEQPAEYCPRCLTNLANPNEKLLKSMNGSVFGNDANIGTGAFGADSGDLILTSKRLIALKEKMSDAILAGALGSLGAIGGAVSGVFSNEQKRHFSFEIPLESVAAVEDAKFGLFKAILVRVNDGQAYRMKMPKREKDEWKAILAVKK